MRRMPFGASCRLPIGRLGRQRQPPQSGYRTRPHSVMRINSRCGINVILFVGASREEDSELVLGEKAVD